MNRLFSAASGLLAEKSVLHPRMIQPDRRVVFVILAALAWGVLQVGSAECRADQFALLETDPQAMQARVDLIQQAEHEICVAYYAINTGIVPVATLELLRRAARRGVSVRLLVDGLISRLPSNLEAYLRRAGIQVRVYHAPHTGRPVWLNRRMHDKCLIVDSQHVIIGSRNLVDAHFGLARQNYTDCDAYASGGAAVEAQSYFDWLWRQPDVMPAPTNDWLRLEAVRFYSRGDSDWSQKWHEADSDADYQRLMTQSLTELCCRMPVQYQNGIDWPAMSVPVQSLGLLHDRYTHKCDRLMEEQIAKVIHRANHSILLETPYPVFTPTLCQALLAARRRGVAVTVLTNSLATTDRACVYAAYQNDKRRLLAAGVQLYETCGANHFHAKSMVVDDRIFTIGSFNFDPRSSRLNLELNLLGCDELAAAMLRDSILRRKRESTRVTIEHMIAGVGENANLVARIKMHTTRLAITAIRWLL